MIKTAVSLFYILISTTAFSTVLPNNQHLSNYEATYDVFRNGKVMAEQKTKVEKSTAQKYTLTDVTTGTKGLAAFTGFKRSESSNFTSLNADWVVQKHKMQQKVTFSKRNYSFQQNEQSKQIEGIHKKETFLLNNIQEQPIAAHMLPLRIAHLACREHKTKFKVTLLKSKKTNTFRFTASTEDNGLIKVARKYPKKSNKKSYIWLDPKQQCITVRSKHIDDDEVIETKLSYLNGAKVAM